MRAWIRGLTIVAAMATAWSILSAFSPPPKDVKIALEKGGPAFWEAAAMSALMLDEQFGVKLKIREVADSEAGQAALLAGKADVILSDFVWTSLQRNQGADFTFVPHSLAVGGLMVLPGSKVASAADLKGTTLAAAGGPEDECYLILQAYYASQTGGNLSQDVKVNFGAPPLVNEQLLGNQADASLNSWDFNARALVAGGTQIVSVPEMLKDLGVSQTPPLLGWVFSEKKADKRGAVIKNFLDASFATRQALLTDDKIWETIRPKMNVEDDALFVALRDAYRAGIVTSYSEADIAAAQQTFALLAKFGGAELTGDKPDLAEGTFWAGYLK